MIFIAVPNLPYVRTLIDNANEQWFYQDKKRKTRADNLATMVSLYERSR